MRAPVQMKRPRRTGRQTASEGDAGRAPVGTGRPTHVRNRLILAVAVVAAAVTAAGAPSLVTASQQMSGDQDLVTLAQRTENALTLAHALADERDRTTSYVAAGRPRSKAPSADLGARVDQQAEEVLGDTGTPAALRAELDTIAAVRRDALTGKGTALDTHEAYTALITDLHKLADELAEQMPLRAGSGAYALAELDSAVQQSAAARGLLLAALNVPSTTQTVYDPLTGLPTTTRVTSEAGRKQRDALTAAAQQARLRADAALADFHEQATEQAVTTYDSTVTGPEADSADKYLAALTDQPTLSDGELGTDTKKLDSALSARVELMRGVESSLYDHRTKDLAQLRDGDVAELEFRVAALGALLLIAVGTATALARTLTRPLSVLRRGSARLAEAEDWAAEEPVAFTGRNDEFAQAVRCVNALHERAVALHERTTTLETDRKHLVGQRQKMADAREELRSALEDSRTQLQQLRAGIGGTFVNLALRTLGLVDRQLAVIEGLEEREQDPDRLGTLFKLDHFATVMRRHSENLLVIAGSERVVNHQGPVPLVDVVRAAVSEIERYERVRIAALPPHVHVVGFAADDLSHLLAELMENAASFSPPKTPVEISGWLLESGEVMLSVQDEGIGMAAERMERINARLADAGPDTTYGPEAEDGLGLGLYVVGRLAHRHGVRVQLREQRQGGVAAVVVLSKDLMADASVKAVPSPQSTAGGIQVVSLPGADAEANSNVLHGRSPEDDPLVMLAEQAVRRSAEAPEPGHEPAVPEHRGGPGEQQTTDTADRPAPEERSTDPGDEHGSGPGERAAATERLTGPAEHAAVPDNQPGPAEPAAVPERQAGPAVRAAEDGESGTGTATRAAGTGSGTGTAEHAAVPEPAVSPETLAETTMELRAPNPAAIDAASTGQPGATAFESGATASEPGTTASQPDATDVDPGATVPEPGSADPEVVAEPSAFAAVGEAAGEATHERTPDLLTAKGLPKRTPKITASPQAPRRPSGSVDAEALRRRLGGFRLGAEAGRRDVAAEIAGQRAETRPPTARSAEETVKETMAAGETTGGTVEEASS
jgi:signal transduction histidine kinase